MTMSLVPSSDPSSEVVIRRTELKPVDPKDSPSWWRRFCDGVRRVVGRRPVELADRFVEANIRKVEGEANNLDAEAAAKVLRAKAEYEKAQAEARLIRAKASLKEAEGRVKREEAPPSARDRLEQEHQWARRLADARDGTEEEAKKALREAITQIVISGGCVEIVAPDVPSEDLSAEDEDEAAEE